MVKHTACHCHVSTLYIAMPPSYLAYEEALHTWAPYCDLLQHFSGLLLCLSNRIAM